MLLSPAFGTVQNIQQTKYGTLNIAIFLSPMDVHVQYVPIHGKIVKRIYDDTGKFYLAFDLQKAKENEKVITHIKPWFDETINIKITQIAGKFVRLIVSYVNYGHVNAGQLLGMIKLGSSVDIEVPIDKFTLLVKKGDYVNGPNSILGVFTK